MELTLFQTKINLIVISALLLIPTASFAEIHRWVDSKGNIHFGDKAPVNGPSSQVELDILPPADPVPFSEPRVEVETVDFETEQLLEEIKLRDEAEQRQKEALVFEKEQRCIQGRERLAVLEQEMPVYRDEKGVLKAAWSLDVYKAPLYS